MENIVRDLINSGSACAMTITGGGTGAISELLRHGGASKFLVDAYIPYSTESFNLLTGAQDKFVTVESAQRLNAYTAGRASIIAQNCDEKVINLLKEDSKPIVVASTAKLTYSGERVGREHRAYIAITANPDLVNQRPKTAITFEFVPQEGTREDQEDVLSRAILYCIHFTLGLGTSEDVLRMFGVSILEGKDSVVQA